MATATNSLSVAVRSLSYYKKSHLAVALGVAAATAVMVGALVVGDSVRYSLRSLVEKRLDGIDALLHAQTFMAEETLELENTPAPIAPAIFFPSASVEHRRESTEGESQLTRASRVQVVGVDQRFSEQLSESELPALQSDEVALNASLAAELGAVVGDEVSILISDPSGVPKDSALGKKEDTTVSIPRQKLVAILPDKSIGGFSLFADQSTPRNVFASLETLQDLLECGPRVNAAFAFTPDSRLDGEDLNIQLNLALQPKLEDYGLKLERHRRVFPDEELGEKFTEKDGQVEPTAPEVIFDYYQLSSTQLLIDDPTSDYLHGLFDKSKTARVMSYLINTISKVNPQGRDTSNVRRASNFENARIDAPRLSFLQPGDVIGETMFTDTESREEDILSREVPYSIIVGIDDKSDLQLRKYWDLEKFSKYEMYAPYVYINSWLAEQVDAREGDWLELKYFRPETIDGKEVERALRVMIAGVVPLVEPDRPFTRRNPAVFTSAPSIFNDPNLTPSVPGVTDQDSIANWDLPFELEKKSLIETIDDEYWRNHRLTPKLFMPYRYTSWEYLFESRFGDTTAFRFKLDDSIPAEEFESNLREQLETALLQTRRLKGLTFRPIRAQQLEAASGTTPFDALFLSLSFFVIAAALLLVYLLFQLGLQNRSAELGILSAQGFTARRIRKLLLTEFLLVSVLGALIGVLLGLAYAGAMIVGLESLWLGAISARFLEFHATPMSILIGAILGFGASLAALYWGLKRASQSAPLENLRGVANLQATSQSRFGKLYWAGALLFMLGALGVGLAANGQAGMARAGAFFGCGICMLIACILAFRQLMERSSENSAAISGGLFPMAWRAIGRNPNRSLLSLSLLSVASFLIASMGVFQISPSEEGYGGFNLIAESSQPIYRNLSSTAVRREQLGDKAKNLTGSTILPAMARSGGDASCNNLYQVAEPTIIGLSDRLAEFHDFAPDSVPFAWAAAKDENNPWNSISKFGTGSKRSPIPVILDQNTAMWSLKQGTSLGSIISLEIDNQELNLRVVGLLSNSVLQGKLVISEGNFRNLFPELGGYSFFLIKSGEKEPPASVASTLEEGWSNEGLDVQESEEVLAGFLGVQNTYISAFQSLGALGLLLGSFGLIAVQVRSVLERKREFAVMRAVGFAHERLSGLLTIETLILLSGGLLIGVVCALFALVPYIIEVGPKLNLIQPILMLLGVLAIGFIASLVAVRYANKQSVLEGLRSE
ncbi:MAG: FtsX-like permease family protein [Pirellulaceae bacterium]